jgi:hypothetical protein
LEFVRQVVDQVIKDRKGRVKGTRVVGEEEVEEQEGLQQLDTLRNKGICTPAGVERVAEHLLQH